MAADGSCSGSVPSTNRGLKSPLAPVLPASGAFRAVGAVDGLCIDWITFTCKVDGYIAAHAAPGLEADMLKSCDRDECDFDFFASHVAATFFPDMVGAVTLDLEELGFRNFYRRHFQFKTNGDQCGFIAFSGEHQRDTFCVVLTGAGVCHLKEWQSIRAKLESAHCKLTRVDVAYDDFEGKYSLDDVRRWHADGLFTTKGRPPAYGHAGFTDGTGETVYIGKNAGNQQLCAYEKGKQLGDPDSKWLRLEGRFGAKYREISLDILTDPAAYLAGHFKPLAFVAQAVKRMKTSALRAASELKKAMKYCSIQYGGFLKVVRNACPNQHEFGRFVESFTHGAKWPAWVKSLPFRTQTFPPAVRAVLA